MERQNLTEPFDLHLQWFAEPPAAPPATPPAAPPGGPEPTPSKPPEPTPPPAPEPELKADGTFLAQAPDKYKKDQKFLKDLLKHKSWGDVLDRLYAGEQQLTEAQGKLAAVPQKPEDYQFPELKFPEYLAGDQFKDHREQLGTYLKAKDEELRAAALKAGLNKDAAAQVSGFFREAVFGQWKATQDEYERQRAAGLKALKEAWKGDFAANEELAKRAILTFDKDKVLEAIITGGAENNPGIIKLFRDIGAAIGEGQLVPGKPGPSAPTEEQKKAAALKQRYPLSPELTGAPPAAAAVDQAALDRLAKRYPQQAAEKKP